MEARQQPVPDTFTDAAGAEFMRRAMAAGYDVYHAADACIIGDESRVRDHLARIESAGATDFAAVEFCRGDEDKKRTRELLRSLI